MLGNTELGPHPVADGDGICLPADGQAVENRFGSDLFDGGGNEIAVGHSVGPFVRAALMAPAVIRFAVSKSTR